MPNGWGTLGRHVGYIGGKKFAKKKEFLRSNLPRGGGTLDRHVGHVGPRTLECLKIYEKKNFFLIEKVTIQIQNFYVKHQYQHSTYLTLYPP